MSMKNTVLWHFEESSYFAHLKIRRNDSFLQNISHL